MRLTACAARRATHQLACTSGRAAAGAAGVLVVRAGPYDSDSRFAHWFLSQRSEPPSSSASAWDTSQVWARKLGARTAAERGGMDEYGCGMAIDGRRYAHKESQHRINLRLKHATTVGQVRAEALRRRPPHPS